MVNVPGRPSSASEDRTDMPPARKPARKPTAKVTRRPAKKATRKSAKGTKKSAQRTMSPAHRRALVEGRTMSATVDRYLAAVNTPKQRGRKVTKAALTQRLSDAQTRFKTAVGVDKVVAAQEVRDLKERLGPMNTEQGVDLKSLEAAFVKIAKTFSTKRGIRYGAWRDAGVPAAVLKRAGIVRTRG
jgi:hypothetical protein